MNARDIPLRRIIRTLILATAFILLGIVVNGIVAGPRAGAGDGRPPLDQLEEYAQGLYCVDRVERAETTAGPLVACETETGGDFTLSGEGSLLPLDLLVAVQRIPQASASPELPSATALINGSVYSVSVLGADGEPVTAELRLRVAVEGAPLVDAPTCYRLDRASESWVTEGLQCETLQDSAGSVVTVVTVVTDAPAMLAIMGESDQEADPLQLIADEAPGVFVEAGSQFLLWPLEETAASAVFGALEIAWLFDQKALAWVAYIPVLGRTDYTVRTGDVLWLVSDEATEIVVAGAFS